MCTCVGACECVHLCARFALICVSKCVNHVTITCTCLAVCYTLLPLPGGVATIALLILVPYKKPPHPILQFILGVCAFVFSIAWLNIQAGEVVATLEAFGLLFDIDTGESFLSTFVELGVLFPPVCIGLHST